jgi:uncharacterized protein (DUF58 family)
MKKVKTYTKVINLFALLIASFVFAMFQGGFVSWFLFYAFCPFALYSIALFFYPLPSFEVERKLMKKECMAGDTVEVRITLTRNNRFPLLYVMIEDEMEQSLICSSKSLVLVGFKKTIEWKYSLEDTPRGKHVFHGIRLHTGDFLGLCQKKNLVHVVESIIAFPVYYELSTQELERLFDGNQGYSQRTRHQQSVISGVREYQAGDQLSWINWKATAKTNKMMTKEFEEQKSEHLCIILDREPTASFEEMIIFVASFVHTVMKHGNEIGFIDSENEVSLPIRKGDRHRKAIFYQLAQVQPSESESFDRNLLKRNGTLANQTRLVMITTQLTFEKLEAISAYKTNQAVTCLVVQTEGITEVDYMVKEAAFKRGISVSFWTAEETVGRRAL